MSEQDKKNPKTELPKENPKAETEKENPKTETGKESPDKKAESLLADGIFYGTVTWSR